MLWGGAVFFICEDNKVRGSAGRRGGLRAAGGGGVPSLGSSGLLTTWLWAYLSGSSSRLDGGVWLACMPGLCGAENDCLPRRL